MGTETTRKFELSLLIAALGSKMKSFFSFVVIFATVALVANADKATNDFLDQLLDNARPTIAKELDPIKLPEKRHTFSKKIIFVFPCAHLLFAGTQPYAASKKSGPDSQIAGLL